MIETHLKAEPHESGNPAELRAVFGRNLRELAAAEPSITQLCARLGINRTQFNRYLSGETFPRPDILHRICSYFGVDARILLEPLSVQRPAPRNTLAQTLGEKVLATNDFNIEGGRLKDGLYRFWRNSYNYPEHVMANMCRVYTEDGVKLFKGYDPPNPMHSPASYPPAWQSVYHGVFLQHDDGVTLMCSTRGQRLLSISFFEYDLGGLPDFMGGLAFLTRRRIQDARRVSFAVLEKMAPGIAPAVAARRECGLYLNAETPPKIREILATVPASI